MKTTAHGKLVDTENAGNGYHGRCGICGLALVTDLGYVSWKGTKCKEREIVSEDMLPKEMVSYAKFHGLNFDVEDGVGYYFQPYGSRYTLEEVKENIERAKAILE